MALLAGEEIGREGKSVETESDRAVKDFLCIFTRGSSEVIPILDFGSLDGLGLLARVGSGEGIRLRDLGQIGYGVDAHTL